MNSRDETIQLGDQSLDYQVTRSARRTVSMMMRFDLDGVLQLRVPVRTKQIEVETFIRKKQKWIFSQLNKPSKKASDIGYADGDYQLFKGEKYKILLKSSLKNQLEFDGQQFHIFSKCPIAMFEAWFKAESLKYLEQRTAQLAVKHHFIELKKVKVRKMRASWGNCRSNGVITYNYHLIKAAPELIDYVIIHELCHLHHPNHSRSFYQLQASILPNWKQLKLNLDESANEML